MKHLNNAKRKKTRKLAWIPSLKLTAKAPENGWLEYDPFLLGWPILRGELLVSGSVINYVVGFLPPIGVMCMSSNPTKTFVLCCFFFGGGDVELPS